MREELPTTQALELIDRSERVLITGPKNLSGDSIGSLLALAITVQNLGKEVTLLSSSRLPEEFNFLSKRELFTRNLTGARDFLIEIDVTRSEVDTLSYDVEGGKLLINVSPARGQLTAKDIATKQGPHKYDLIIVVHTPSVSSMDDIYRKEEQLFHSVPVLNIDHKASNEMFGTVNLVDKGASSTAEIVASLIKELNVEFDREIATPLLTGILAATDALRGDTSPNTLRSAAELIESGASKEKILEHLNRTKTRTRETDRELKKEEPASKEIKKKTYLPPEPVDTDDSDEDLDFDFYPNIPPPKYLKPKEGILTWRPDDKE